VRAAGRSSASASLFCSHRRMSQCWGGRAGKGTSGSTTHIPASHTHHITSKKRGNKYSLLTLYTLVKVLSDACTPTYWLRRTGVSDPKVVQVLGEGRDTNTNAVAALAALSGCLIVVVAEVIHHSQSLTKQQYHHHQSRKSMSTTAIFPRQLLKTTTLLL
jgi:hypothetical protein